MVGNVLWTFIGKQRCSFITASLAATHQQAINISVKTFVKIAVDGSLNCENLLLILAPLFTLCAFEEAQNHNIYSTSTSNCSLNLKHQKYCIRLPLQS